MRKLKIKSYWIVPLLFWGSLQAEQAVEYPKGNELYPYSESDFFRNQDALSDLIKKNSVQTIIEVGCWYGESTIFMAQQLPEGGKIYAIDSWIGYPREIYKNTLNVYKRFLSNVVHAGQTEKVIPVRMTSLSASRTFSKYEAKADLIYIDADHAYKAVYSDIKAWSPYLKEGGMLCGNLYTKDKQSQEIKKAVTDYCKRNGKKATFDNYLWRIE
jgi:cephalosporin hydroxylase